MTHPYARAKVTAVSDTAASLDLSGKAKVIVLSSTTDCWINFNSTAVINKGFYLPADEPIEITVGNKGSVSVIRDTANGYLSILEEADVPLITIVHRFFTSNANLKVEEATSINGDASLLRIIAATFTGNSLIDTLHESSFTGDSHFAVIVSDTFSGDSNLKRVDILGDTFDGQSYLKGYFRLFKGDASLLSVVADTFTGDCNLAT